MIDERPHSERPRERLLSAGAESLSLRELIAVLLGSGPRGQGCLGAASALLARSGGGNVEQEHAFFLGMETSPVAQLQDIAGIGSAGRARIAAAFELGRRYSRFHEIRTGDPPPPAGAIVRRALGRIGPVLRSARQEWLGFVAIDVNGQVGDFCLVEKGARTHVNVDPLELFARILALRPMAILLAHNHPSGSLRASAADRELTERVASLLDGFGIGLLGHYVVTGVGVRRVD